jgi:hypothetical protein
VTRSVCRGAFVTLLLALPVTAAAQSVPWYRFNPQVVPASYASPVKLEASVTGSPTLVQLVLNVGGTITMLDDGTGGDAVAGDGVYTASIPAATILSNLAADDAQREFVGYLDIYSGATRVFRGNMFVDVYSPSVGTYPIRRLASNAQATTRVFNIVDAAYLTDGNTQRVAQAFYHYFGDAYDFLNIVSTPAQFQNRFHAPISNSISGIGFSIVNNSAGYGSAGRLRGVSVFPDAGYFDGAEVGFVHELGHQWVSQLSFAPFTEGVPHWPVSSMATGIMGFSIGGGGGEGGTFACHVVDDGTNVTLQATSATPVFNDFDLYLMGLLAPASVQPQVVLPGLSSPPVCTGQVYSGSVIRVNVNTIITGAGARVPDTSTSPKNFRAATILVSRDALESQETMWLYSWLTARGESQSAVPTHAGFVKQPGSPFYIATGGRGTLDTRLRTRPAFDADGDGRADMTLYKANGDWAMLKSSSNFTSSITKNWGGPGYTAAPGDYDGDGEQDLGLYRESTGAWLVKTSSSGFASTMSFNWGGPGYKAEPGDYDGDGKVDPTVYNTATGVWSILLSSSGYASAINVNWGGAGYTPVPGQDFDGDAIADVVVYRAATGVWSILTSSSNFTAAINLNWGGPGYVLVPGDYDGDGKADPAVYNRSTGGWSVLLSGGGYTTALNKSWGGAGYVPVPADFDGDGITDLGIFQTSTGNWYALLSGSGYTTSMSVSGWGAASDLPVSAAIVAGGSDVMRASDFDGDGKSEITVYNTSTGVWSILKSSGSYATAMNVGLGGSGYTPTPGDFDGDGKTDVAVYQATTGNWSVLLSSTSFTTSLSKSAGGSGWLPVPADYDGDGKTDFAVYNTTSGTWYVLKSSTNFTTVLSVSWGGTGYTADAGDFDGDGKADLAVYRQSTGDWYVLLSSGNYTTTISKNVGGPGYVPVAGDYDGDGKADFVAYNSTTGLWYGLKSSTGYTTSISVAWGGTGYTPIKGDYDGDGRNDLALYRSSTGAWSILLSSSNYTTTLTKNWGGSGYTALPVYP